ncbi:MAG TPA: carbamoyltransferase C-terminal domain-containing protein [Chloroflexota bacterium]|nr:carbamoyltransferase C-terminal domain-containing protein [Chloroflexota bacterium]
MIVLGLIDSKPSAAAVLQDGRVLAAIAEERLCRMKLASGLPRAAIMQALSVAGVAPTDIDQVAVAQKVSVFEPQPIPWKGWFDDSELKTRRFDGLSGSLAPLFGRFPLAWKAHHQVKRLRSQERVQQIPAILRQDFAIHVPVTFYDHHYCHATAAYYASSFDEALVVTLDGGGDGLSGTVYVGRGGRLERLTTVDSFNSLGNFYSYITELCGFKAEKHEGKVTGLAALGQPLYADILRQFIRYQEPGQIRYSVPMYHRSALRLLAERLPANFDRAHLAASVQLVLEEIGTAFVQHWLRQTGLRRVAVAGGVFANVKFNQRVHELPEVDRIFIYPAMDDGGLATGSALAALAAAPGIQAADLQQPLAHVYYGPRYNDAEVERAMRDAGCPVSYEADIHGRIAELLAQGHVVARFTGPMEFGPRALGHRSILYQTTDPAVNDWLNDNLHRTEFMPFAPATLIEHAAACYEGMAGAEDPARFMTITFNCTPQMRTQSPGVVHVDGTARPQLIDNQTAPDFYGILQAYYRLTGIPSLINTSFNMHEEPIVCSPADALRSFQQGNLDYLALDNWLVANPAMPDRSLRATAVSGSVG